MDFVNKSLNGVSDNIFCCGPINIATVTPTITSFPSMSLSSFGQHKGLMKQENTAWLSLPRGGESGTEIENPFGYTAVGKIIHTQECEYKGRSGIIYITERAICYRGIGLFGYEVDRLIIPYEIVKEITKDNDQAFRLAIIIETTKREVHEFTHVQEKDTAITLLQQSWQEAKISPPSPIHKSAINSIFRSITTLTATESESLSFSEDTDSKDDTANDGATLNQSSITFNHNKELWNEFVEKINTKHQEDAHQVVKVRYLNIPSRCSTFKNEDFGLIQ